MGKVILGIRMDQSIKESGLEEKERVKVHRFGLMVGFSKETGRKMKCMDMVCSFGQMAVNLRVYGSSASNTVNQLIVQQLEKYGKVSGKMVSGYHGQKASLTTVNTNSQTIVHSNTTEIIKITIDRSL